MTEKPKPEPPSEAELHELVAWLARYGPVAARLRPERWRPLSHRREPRELTGSRYHMRLQLLAARRSLLLLSMGELVREMKRHCRELEKVEDAHFALWVELAEWREDLERRKGP